MNTTQNQKKIFLVVKVGNIIEIIMMIIMNTLEWLKNSQK